MLGRLHHCLLARVPFDEAIAFPHNPGRQEQLLRDQDGVGLFRVSGERIIRA
jgi:hypothetical protein